MSNGVFHMITKNNYEHMKSNTSQLFTKKKKLLLEGWIKQQLTEETLREDLISNEDLRIQSDELLSALIKAMQGGNYEDLNTPEFETILEILSGISITRA